MADFLYGLRRMMGLTTPAEDADMMEREEKLVEQTGLRYQPGTALRERQDTLDAAQQELQRQGAPAAQPVAAPVAPAAQPVAPGPRYGEDVSPAMRALEGYGVRGSVNSVKPPARPEDEERRQQRGGGGFIRG